jgi:hypothetical protein
MRGVPGTSNNGPRTRASALTTSAGSSIRIQVDVTKRIRVAVDEIGGELEQESSVAYAAGANKVRRRTTRKQAEKVRAVPPRDRRRRRDLQGQNCSAWLPVIAAPESPGRNCGSTI